MNRRIRKLEAAAPGAYPREDSALLYYGISALHGMAALAFAIIFLREARTVCDIAGHAPRLDEIR